MYLEVLKQKEMFYLGLWRISDKEKHTIAVFSCFKLTRNLCLVYLKVKMLQNRCCCCIQ